MGHGLALVARVWSRCDAVALWRGRRGAWRHPPSVHVAGVALLRDTTLRTCAWQVCYLWWHGLASWWRTWSRCDACVTSTFVFPRQSSHTFTHNGWVSHTQQLWAHTLGHNFVTAATFASQAWQLSHTSHTQHCHKQLSSHKTCHTWHTHNWVSHNLSHTTCHTHTRNLRTHNFLTHAQLCQHTQPSHDTGFGHTWSNLSHKTVVTHTHNFVTHTQQLCSGRHLSQKVVTSLVNCLHTMLWHRPLFHVAGVALLVAHPPSFPVAGVALGDIHRRSLCEQACVLMGLGWQCGDDAWGPAVTPSAFCVAGVDAWFDSIREVVSRGKGLIVASVTSTVVLRDPGCGTYGTEAGSGDAQILSRCDKHDRALVRK